MESLFILIVYFAICSLIGWIIQNIFSFIIQRKFTTKRFLYGPVIPIYGFVALIIYFYNLYLQNFPLIIKLLSYFIIPVVIEYFTFYLLKKIFNLKLWDYSNYHLNFKGRICLGINIFWFFLVLFGVFVVQPFLIENLQKLSPVIVSGLSAILFVYFIIDFILSVKKHYYAKIGVALKKIKKGS